MTEAVGKLCAVIQAGEIQGVAVVDMDHEFGDRLGYSHVEVERFWSNGVPEEYDEPSLTRHPYGIEDMLKKGYDIKYIAGALGVSGRKMKRYLADVAAQKESIVVAGVNFTQGMISDILEMRRDGVKVSEIGEKYGIHASGINWIVRSQGDSNG